MRSQFLLAALLGSTLAACSAELPSEDRSTTTGSQFLRSANPVRNEYIVVLRDDVADVGAVAASQANAAGGAVGRTYHHALRGYALRAPEATARRLLDDPRVKYVEENGVVGLAATQTGAPWGLDRVDQRVLPWTSPTRTRRPAPV